MPRTSTPTLPTRANCSHYNRNSKPSSNNWRPAYEGSTFDVVCWTFDVRCYSLEFGVWTLAAPARTGTPVSDPARSEQSRAEANPRRFGVPPMKVRHLMSGFGIWSLEFGVWLFSPSPFKVQSSRFKVQ